MPDLISTENVDKLPVLVSGGGNYKLQGIPKLTSGIEVQIVTAAVEYLKDWNIKDNVKAAYFDTTSSKTGCKKGACVTIVFFFCLHTSCAINNSI